MIVLKVSEITIQQMKDYMRVDYEDDDNIIETIMLAVIAFMKGYTGLTAEEVDNKPDMILAYKVLVNEMHSERQLTVDKNKMNVVVSTILDMHAVNLL